MQVKSSFSFYLNFKFNMQFFHHPGNADYHKGKTKAVDQPHESMCEPVRQDQPETAQTGEHLEGYSLSLGETVTIYFYVTLPEDTPQDAAMQFTLPDSTVTQVAVADAKQVEVNGKSCTAFPCHRNQASTSTM